MSNYCNDFKNPNQRPSWAWFGKELKEVKTKAADKRFWIFVKHNPLSNDLPTKFKDLVTVTWQLEKGSRGIPHLQGVVQFLYPKSFGQVRDMLPKAYWHPMLGTHQEAMSYCSKVPTRVEGPWVYNSLDRVVEECIAGLSGVVPLDHGGSAPSHRAQIEDSVEPAVAQPPPAATQE